MKKWILRRLLNVTSEVALLMKMGRAFNKVGTACTKLRFPSITVRAFGTTSANESYDLKVLLGLYTLNMSMI